MPFGDRRFDFGINIGWFDSQNGHDISHDPYHSSWGSYLSRNPQVIDSYFRDISERGFKVVRIWVFEKMEGLIFDSSAFNPTNLFELARRSSFAVNDENSWDWDIPLTESTLDYNNNNIPNTTGIRESLISNVRRIMVSAQSHDLEIHWTLLSGGNYNKYKYLYHSWALEKLLSVRELRSNFLRNGVAAFLNIIKDYQSNVYAIDLINEPEGLEFNEGRYSMLIPSYLFYYIEDAKRLIREFNRINSTNFKITAGFAGWRTIQRHQDVFVRYLDFYQTHKYGIGTLDWDASVSLGNIVGAFNKPVILGEYNSGGEFTGIPHDNVANPEELTIAITNYLENSLAIKIANPNDFKGCFVWRYGVKEARILAPSGQVETPNGLDLVHTGRFSSNRTQFISEFARFNIGQRNLFWKDGVWQAINEFAIRLRRLYPECVNRNFQAQST